MPKPSLSLPALALVGPLLFLASCGGGDDAPAVDASAQECQAITDTGSVVVGSGLPGETPSRCWFVISLAISSHASQTSEPATVRSRGAVVMMSSKRLRWAEPS